MSGDAVAGQVVGANSDGDTSGDATNATMNAHVRSGDSDAANTLFRTTFPSRDSGFASDVSVADIGSSDDEDDDDEDDFIDTMALTGDAVAGQIIGLSTTAGGSADLVGANTSDVVDARSGDAEAFDSGDSTTGDALAGQVLADQSSGISSLDATNRSHRADVRTGDAFAQYDDAKAVTGTALGGEIVGLVTGPSGMSDVVAANDSDDVDARSGDAFAKYDSVATTGESIGGQAIAAAIDGRGTIDATNLSQDTDTLTGDATARHDTQATTGDAIAGEIIGLVTSPGGSADLVEANTSQVVDARSGDADAADHDIEFEGLFTWPIES